MPATDMEALKSPLMGLFEKRRARKFFIYVQDYDENDPKTHEGMDLTRVTTRELISYVYTYFIVLYCCTDHQFLIKHSKMSVALILCLNINILQLFLNSYRKYGLDENTIDFIGHALALHRDDRYLNEPALDTVKRMKVI